MRLSLWLAALVILSGCATATVERSQRNEVAVASAATEERLNFAVSIKVRNQQVFIPSIADGKEEFCSTSGTFFASGGPRPMLMCFSDTDNSGRFNRAYTVRERRAGGGVAVNIPYALAPFPCSSCIVPSVDLTHISDPQQLAEYSLAPPHLRPYVQMALANSPDVASAIDRSGLPDPAAVKQAVQIATNEVRDRRAVTICSAQNPGSAVAGFGLIGSIAAIVGGASEKVCMEEYLATGRMPAPPSTENPAFTGD
jgi:hypothetical protein